MVDTLKEDDDKGRADDELVIVEDEERAAPADDPKLRAAEEDDDHDQDHDHDNPEDPDGTERDAIRERRRLEKLERKQRREEAIKRDKLEMDFLRKRNEDLERRLTTQELRAQQQDLQAVDTQMQQALRDAQAAEQVIAKAVAAGNGEDVTRAMRLRDDAVGRYQQLNATKQQQQQQQQASRTTAPPVDPEVMHHAQQFIKDHKWYDPQGRDEDSAVVLAIDAALVRDGFNPRSADYWDELKRRASRRLPERFATQGAPSARQPRGGPVVGSGREHAPESTRREVYISPERKQALIDAGVWDDPVLRQKYVKRYADYDRSRRSQA